MTLSRTLCIPFMLVNAGSACLYRSVLRYLPIGSAMVQGNVYNLLELIVGVPMCNNICNNVVDKL